MDVKKKELKQIEYDSQQASKSLQYELDMISPLQVWLDSYKHCELCGSELIYTHVTQFIEETVCEEAHCPSCNIKNKQAHHRLQ